MHIKEDMDPSRLLAGVEFDVLQKLELRTTGFLRHIVKLEEGRT
jgi:hypothetical protein